ncbi:MAG: hypothetical protein ACFFDO_09120 [Candidatus Thorarchaeota archaeon]
MSVDKLQEQVDKFLEERDALEEKCDTLPLCEEDDGCERCETYKKISALDEKIEKLEDEIEELLVAEEEEE